MNTMQTKTIYSFHCLFIAGVMIFGKNTRANDVNTCEPNPVVRSQLQKLYTDSCALSKRELKNMSFNTFVHVKGSVENALAFLALKGFTYNEVSELTQNSGYQNTYRTMLANSGGLNKAEFSCDEDAFAKRVRSNIVNTNKSKLRLVRTSCNQLIEIYERDPKNFLVQFKNGKVDIPSLYKRQFGKSIIQDCSSYISLNRDNNPLYDISTLDFLGGRIDSLLSSASWANLEATKWDSERAEETLAMVETVFKTASDLVFTGLKYKCQATLGLAAKFVNGAVCDQILNPIKTTYNHFVMNGGEFRTDRLFQEVSVSQRKQVESTVTSGVGRLFVENELLRNTLTTGFDLVRNHDCSSSDQATRECVIKVTKKFTQEALKNEK